MSRCNIKTFHLVLTYHGCKSCCNSGCDGNSHRKIRCLARGKVLSRCCAMVNTELEGVVGCGARTTCGCFHILMEIPDVVDLLGNYFGYKIKKVQRKESSVPRKYHVTIVRSNPATDSSSPPGPPPHSQTMIYPALCELLMGVSTIH